MFRVGGKCRDVAVVGEPEDRRTRYEPCTLPGGRRTVGVRTGFFTHRALESRKPGIVLSDPGASCHFFDSSGDGVGKHFEASRCEGRRFLLIQTLAIVLPPQQVGNLGVTRE